MKRYQTNDGFVRRALLANAVFSFATGLICVLAPSWVAGLLLTGDFIFELVTSPFLILDLGIGLLLFAGLVFYAARKPMLNLTLVKAISVADLAWVLLSLLVLVFAPAALTSIGFTLMMAIAIVVLVFAMEQLVGAALTYQGQSDIVIRFRDGEMTLSAARPTSASPDRVWQVISHQEAYADVADNIQSVAVVSGAGKGMVRRCADTKGRTWRETCTGWDEGKGFAFDVHTGAPDYPYPIAALSGEWFLAPTDRGTMVHMVFKVRPKAGPINRLLFKAMAAPFAKICDRLLWRWVAIMEGKANADQHSASGVALAPPAPTV